jgi:hypothetical protein
MTTDIQGTSVALDLMWYPTGISQTQLARLASQPETRLFMDQPLNEDLLTLFGNKLYYYRTMLRHEQRQLSRGRITLGEFNTQTLEDLEGLQTYACRIILGETQPLPRIFHGVDPHLEHRRVVARDSTRNNQALDPADTDTEDASLPTVEARRKRKACDDGC